MFATSQRIVRDEVALAHAALEHVREQFEALLPERRHLRDHRVGQLADHRLVLERPEDLEVLAMRRPVLDVEAAHAPDLLGGRERGFDRLAHLALEDVAVGGEHRDVELGLVLEVAVERALRDARARRDLVEIRRP